DLAHGIRPARVLDGLILRALDLGLTAGHQAGLHLLAHATLSVACRSPAIIRPSTSRGVSPGTMPTTSPRYITAIRSARAETSSSSVETTTTATPASLASMIRLCTNSI